MNQENVPGNLLSFEDFVSKCRMMDEACRQWCDLIDDAPGRSTGALFSEFYHEICEQKYDEYLTDPLYRANCDYCASLTDAQRYELASQTYEYAEEMAQQEPQLNNGDSQVLG